MKNTGKNFKVNEVWYQDPEDPDLWRGEHGVIVNTSALNEREFYYEIIRVTARAAYYEEHPAYAWLPDPTLPAPKNE